MLSGAIKRGTRKSNGNWTWCLLGFITDTIYEWHSKLGRLKGKVDRVLAKCSYSVWLRYKCLVFSKLAGAVWNAKKEAWKMERKKKGFGIINGGINYGRITRF